MKQIGEITDFLEYLAEAIIVVNESSDIVFANLACLKLFGYQKDKMMQLRLEKLMHQKYAAHHHVLVSNYISNRSNAKEMQSRTTITCVNANGKEFHARISIAAVDMAGRLYGVATIQDFTPIEDEMATLEMHSNIDPLTSLYNRYYLEMISRNDSRIMQQWKTIGVLYIDLDKFKPVNDKYGHEAGDTVLMKIAQRLRGKVRHDDLILRLGGDEFLVLCNLTDVDEPKSQINRIATMIVKQISRPVLLEEHSLEIGASIGAAIFPDNGNSLKELINLADKAMYKAKQSQAPVYFVD